MIGLRARAPAAACLVAALAACASEGPPVEPCRRDAPGAPWVAFAAGAPGRHDVVVARADGSCAAPISSGGDNLFPTFSPAGLVAFATDRDGGLGLRIHDLATGEERVLAVGALYASAPAFSPDGASVAFEGRAPGEAATDVYVVPASGGTPLRLTDDVASDAAPAWSPDGATVYFVSDRAGGPDVHAVPAGGGAAARVTTGSAILGRPAVSPDGAVLAWARAAPGGASEVVALTLASGDLRVVSSHGDSEPAFDPSGARLAVRTLRWTGLPAVAALDARDGGHVVRISAGDAAAGTPAFAR